MLLGQEAVGRLPLFESTVTNTVILAKVLSKSFEKLYIC